MKNYIEINDILPCREIIGQGCKATGKSLTDFGVQ